MRGWTDSLIKKFLVHEDAQRDNPLYKCARESAFQTAMAKDKALEVVLYNF